MLHGNESRENLEFALEENLEELNYKYKDEVISKLMEKGYTRGLSTKMITDPVYLKTLSDVELCVLCEIAHKHIKIKDLDVLKYFNEREIQYAKDFKKRIEKEESDEIILTDVIEVNDDQYVCKVPIQLIGSITNRGLYAYNYNIQREATKRVKRNRISKVPTIYGTKKSSIVKTMIDKRPIGNTSITIVVPPTGDEQFEYNDTKQTIRIVIDENTKFYVCDGFHRWVASNEILSTDPEFNYNWTFNIWHIPMDMAEELTINIDKQTKMKDLHTKIKNKEDLAMVLANEINNYGGKQLNSLYHRLDEELVDTQYGDAYTTYHIFSEALRYCFNDEINGTNLERTKLKKFISDAFVYIIGNFENEFKNKKESFDKTFAVYPNTFIGYMAILPKFYELYKNNSNIWEDEILEVLKNIDFSITNERMIELGLKNENVTKKKVKSIADYFKKLVVIEKETI